MAKHPSTPHLSSRAFRLLISIGLALIVAVEWPASRPHAQASDPCAAPLGNPVKCENALTGNPKSEWDIIGAGDTTIQGFTTDISAVPGQTVQFKIASTAAAYRIDIYRLGYYGGLGARKVATINPSASLPQAQPNCVSDVVTGLIDCGNWAVSASWSVPSTAVSGLYIARPVRTDNGGASHIPFIIRNDTSHSDLLFQTSDTTWQAYNNYGGNSLYEGSPAGRAYKVSYNRPFVGRAGFGRQSNIFWAEYPMLRFLEANGFDVSYSTGVDTARRGAELLEHKVFLSVGHDEYWSATQRANVEAARDAGVNLAFLSGNEVFWKTRWETSIDGSATANRTLVCYKETHAGAKIDPSSEWTGTWRDKRFSPPYDGGRPENALTGTLFTVNRGTGGTEGNPMEVPSTYKSLRFWRNTAVASLGTGQKVTLANNVLGYEWDESPDNGYRPAGAFPMSSTTESVTEYLQDYGTTYAPGTATHSLISYRALSGALVFSTGTVQWSFGLDSTHDGPFAAPDVNMLQATINVLADMGSQPATLQSGLVAATKSTDTTRPVAVISSPIAGQSLPSGQITVSGTASDSGGVVAGVEVSTDGGTTWHPASGTTAWTYLWSAPQNGSYTIAARAVDDTGNVQTSVASLTVTVSSCTANCSIWPGSATPSVIDAGADVAGESGVKFRATVNGTITGLRFYKASTNTGTHIGSLWSSAGTLLGQATFASETASGWQQVTFTSPIAITAGTVYVASYHMNGGHYSFNPGYFTAGGVISAPLEALGDGVSGGNGVYGYSASPVFPTSTNNGFNAWVDVVFQPAGADTTPPVITSVQATGASASGATISWTTNEAADTQVEYGLTTAYGSTTTLASALVTSHSAALSGLNAGVTYNYRVKSRDAAGNLATSGNFTFVTTTDTTAPTISSVQASGLTTSGATITWTTNEGADTQVDYGLTTSYGASSTLVSTLVTSHSVTLAGLSANTTYNYRVKSRDGANNLATSGNFTFTTAAVVTGCTVNCTIWPSTATPAVVDAGADIAGDAGVKFRATVNGTITGLRFYKSAANTGTHIGSLWSSAGTLLGQATFTGETASGWQQVNFSAPLAVTAGTIYVASYHMDGGHYSFSPSYFTAGGVMNAPLEALGDGVSGGNGVYGYSASPVFPNSTNSGFNAWVDVVFQAAGSDTTAPIISSVQSTGVSTSGATISWTTNEVADTQVEYGLTTAYGSTTTLASALVTSHSAALSGLNAGVTYNYRVKSRDAAGNLATSGNFTFVTTTDTTAPTISSVQASGLTTSGATITWTTNEGADTQVDYGLTTSYGASSTLVSTLVTSHSVTLAGLSANTTYNYRVKSRDGANNLATSGNFTFTTAAVATGCTSNCSIWPSTATPSVVDAGADVAGDSGVKFRATVNGTITGLRFYKASTNTGTHIGSLWSSTGTLLGQATFTSETASGWQQVNFSAPLAVTAGTIYVASYHMVAGHYSFSPGYFTAGGVVNAPLEALGDGVSGGNGVYGYGASPVFPTSTNAGFNAWVDVVFQPAGADTTPPTISSVQASGLTASGATITWTTNEVADTQVEYGLTTSYGSTSAVNAALVSSHSATLSNLTAGTTYNYRVKSRDAGGNLTTSGNFTFTTTAACTVNCSIWASTAAPTVADAGADIAGDSGVKFMATTSGTITGIRFYKSAANTGTHIGSLWSSTGTLLAQATFSGETASGWQQVNFSSPVTITPGSVYVASYHSNGGHYSLDLGYFASSGVTNGPLTALAEGVSGANGVYAYSPSPVFPSSGFNSFNAWVDVVFQKVP